MTLNDYFAEFIEQLRGQSEANRSNYIRRLRGFLRTYGALSPGDISRIEVNQWHNDLRQYGYADASLAGYIQALRAFFRYLVTEEVVATNPANHLKRPSTISPEPKAAKAEHIEAAIAAAWPMIDSDCSLDRRRAAVFFLSVESGGRAGSLNPRLSDWQKGVERGADENGVYRIKSWSKGREVLLEVTEVTVTAVSAYIAVRPPGSPNRLFVGSRCSRTRYDDEARIRPLQSRRLTRDIEEVFEAAGVPVYRTHAIRHYVGDAVYRLFGPKVAAQKLNHADAETTAATATAYYHRPRRDDVSRATAALRPKLPISETEMRQLFGVEGDEST